MKVAVLGSGVVGETLANGFLKHGYEVIRASRDPQKLEAWKSKAGAKASTATFEQAAAQGELVVHSVKGSRRSLRESILVRRECLHGEPEIS